MSKVVFLDIDGVLNHHKNTPKSCRTPQGYYGVMDKYLSCLRELVELTGADIILSSDWKNCFKDDDCNVGSADVDGEYLVRRLAEFGLKISAKTDDKSVGSDYSTGRGFGIRKYLKYHPEIENYVVLDDIRFSDFNGDLFNHFVECKCPFGKRNLKKALRIMGYTDK